MDDSVHKISEERPKIRPLTETAINRIAAGEVVERPASAVKELIENAIDAGARRITVDVADGGKTLIRIVDDGCGIPQDELALALSRHATSKIDGSDLLDIRTFGFRGEALASLAAVGRLTVTSRIQGAAASQIAAEGGYIAPVRPAAGANGTTVTLRDLFYATPARLKFLRTDRAELQAITDVVKRLAMAEPHIRFILVDHSGDAARTLLKLEPHKGPFADALRLRLSDILGQDFVTNAIALDATRDGLHLNGFAALPTYSRGSVVAQYSFVNRRPVRDKLFSGAIRAAYADFLSRDRHPAVALFVSCDPHQVDMNVHPAKSEVRFRDPGIARGLIVSGLRHALADAGHRASTTVGAATLGAMRAEAAEPRVYQMDRVRGWNNPSKMQGFEETQSAFSAQTFDPTPQPHDVEADDLPLGVARGQVHENYIIAQTADGMVIVDQHAAHERLVYERLKAQLRSNGVSAQALLIPAVVDVTGPELQRLLEHADALARLGLKIEAFGGNAVAIREVPAILGEIDGAALLRDVLDQLADDGQSRELEVRIDAVLSRIACHGSVRSGRRMRAEEMNALLRDIEATPHSGQCNHGRPTYVELKLRDIERLFGRS